MGSKYSGTDRRDSKGKLKDYDPKPPAHEGVRAEFQLTEEEYEAAGVTLMQLTPGDWFMIHLASWDLQRTVTFSGKLIYHGVGSCLIEVDRPGTAEDRLKRCAQETKVVPIGMNDRDANFHDPRIESHVDLSQFCSECGTELDELDLCWTDGCGKQGVPQS